MRIRVGLLVAGVALALAVAGCGDDEPSETSTPTTTASTGDSTVMATPPTQPATTAVTTADVNVGSSSLGQILVDGDGMTLYVFLNDTAGTSTCVDACAQAWPPLIATSVSVGSGLDDADFGLIARPDGTQQLAMNDRPLYRFAGDTAPGETAGQGLNDVWFALDPSGTLIEAG